MSLRFTATGFLIATLVACGPGDGESAQEPGEPEMPAPFLEDIESRVVTSAMSGREYQISVALPLGYADSLDRYPVLYALDANGQFGTVAETARYLAAIDWAQIPELLVVGIGYPSGGRFVHSRSHRLYDLTPTNDAKWEARFTGPSDGAGGGPDFLRFLREELFPLIDAEYRTDPSDRALYGHSVGGLFGLYALFEAPGTFQRVIAGSPSLWWDERFMFGLEDAYAGANDSLAARVFLSMGMLEADGVRPDGDCACMLSNLRDLAGILELRRYEGLVWQHHFFEGENHQSVVPATISRGLRFIYDSPN